MLSNDHQPLVSRPCMSPHPSKHSRALCGFHLNFSLTSSIARLKLALTFYQEHFVSEHEIADSEMCKQGEETRFTSPEVDLDSEPKRDTRNLLSEVNGVKEEQSGVSLTSLLKQI